MPIHAYVNNACRHWPGVSGPLYLQTAGWQRDTPNCLFFSAREALSTKPLVYFCPEHLVRVSPKLFQLVWRIGPGLITTALLQCLHSFFAILCSLSFAYFKQFYDFVIQRGSFLSKRSYRHDTWEQPGVLLAQGWWRTLGVEPVTFRLHVQHPNQ